MELETKTVDTASDIRLAIGEMMRTFEEFKGANDERLAALEKRSADAVSEDKVERINRALDDQKRVLDELSLAAQRPALGTRSSSAAAARRAARPATSTSPTAPRSSSPSPTMRARTSSMTERQLCGFRNRRA